MKRLTRKQMLAAQTFDYSYAQYEREFVGSDEPWLNDVDILEKAEQEGWDAARIAQAIDICEEDVWHYQRNYREGKDIVDAPTPAEWFRRSMRYVIQAAVEYDLTNAKEVENLVDYICRRTADLSFCLGEKHLSDYSKELCKEPGYSQTAYHESKNVVVTSTSSGRFRYAVHGAIRTAAKLGLKEKGSIESLVNRICCHAAEFGSSLKLENKQLSDCSNELRERPKPIQQRNQSPKAKGVQVGEGIQKGLAGFNGALAGMIAGVTFGGFSDVVNLLEGIVFMAALGVFIGGGGILKGMSRRIAYERKTESQGELDKLARSVAAVASLYGLVGLLVGITHLLLGKILEGVAIWAIIGVLEGYAVGTALWRSGAG